MTKFVNITVGFIVAVVGLIMIYDVWAITKLGYVATISYTLYQASKSWPVIPLVFGIIAGHLFWPNVVPGEEKK